MAKDGTRRGGARSNSGAKNIIYPNFDEISVDEGINLAKPPKYLSAKQEKGVKLEAKRIFEKTQIWLNKYGVLDKVPLHLIEQYAMTFARWQQAEQMISTYGTLSPHPTTKVGIQSPLVQVSNIYFKDSQTAWYAIWSIAKENIGASDLKTDDMEELLANCEA